MKNGRWLCRKCRRQVSVRTGTIFEDSRLPLQTWFRAIWQVTSRKHGISAVDLRREVGLGTYRSAWVLLHKLRRAMVRPQRERLHGTVEVDETYWGGDEPNVKGRLTYKKKLVLIAVEVNEGVIGRIRLQTVSELTRASVTAFVRTSVEPGSTLRTDGLNVYENIPGYAHSRFVRGTNPRVAAALLPHVHRIASLLKRWLLGTHQGAIGHGQLDHYLNEFAFRFNRRASSSRGKLFVRLLQQAVATPATTVRRIQNPNR